LIRVIPAKSMRMVRVMANIPRKDETLLFMEVPAGS
jgi:hypothetical protein